MELLAEFISFAIDDSRREREIRPPPPPLPLPLVTSTMTFARFKLFKLIKFN